MFFNYNRIHSIKYGAKEAPQIAIKCILIRVSFYDLSFLSPLLIIRCDKYHNILKHNNYHPNPLVNDSVISNLDLFTFPSIIFPILTTCFLFQINNGSNKSCNATRLTKYRTCCHWDILNTDVTGILTKEL